MNAEISVFTICVDAIIYLLLYNLHDRTFKIFIYILGTEISISCTKITCSQHC